MSDLAPENGYTAEYLEPSSDGKESADEESWSEGNGLDTPSILQRERTYLH